MRTQRSGMGGVGERLKKQGTYVYLELIQVVVQQKLTQHCKVIIFQLKNKSPPEFSFKKKIVPLMQVRIWLSAESCSTGFCGHISSLVFPRQRPSSASLALSSGYASWQLERCQNQRAQPASCRSWRSGTRGWTMLWC